MERAWKVQLPENVVNDVGPSVVTVDAVEDIARRFHRQRIDPWAFTVSGNCRDSGNDKETYRLELTQLVNDSADFPSICSLGLENRLGVVEDYEHFVRGKEGS
jgi:hypothetical protein